MSYYATFAVLAGFAFFYSVLAARLERGIVSGALVYVVFGLICGPLGLDFIDLDVDAEGIKQLAELTLALVLFLDATAANLSVLKSAARLPFRLLAIGLPLTIALGLGVGLLMFDGIGIFEIALLATILAPTDAALGKAVVSNEAVPVPVRQGLNAESGLNDGICVPVLFIFLALAQGETQGAETLHLVLLLPLEEIGIGLAVAVVFAYAGWFAIKTALDRDWLAEKGRYIPMVALAFFSFAAAQALGGSGFIACFVGGLVFGKLAQERKEAVMHAAEGVGEVLALVTWIVFGAVVVGQAFQHFDWTAFIYAVLSLTVIRMVPVRLNTA